MEARTKIQKCLQNLCEFEGFAINSVQIVRDGAVLDPERNFSSNGIGAGTQLKLQRMNSMKRWTNLVTDHVLIRIQNGSNRKEVRISCTGGNTFRDLKVRVCELAPFDAHDYSFIFDGEVIDFDSTLRF